MKQSSQSVQSKSHPFPAPVYTAPCDTVAQAYAMAVDWTGAIESVEWKPTKGKKSKKGDPTMKFMGDDMAQAWPDLLIWEALFNQYPMRTFVELGSGHGGLALFFALQCYQRGIEFHTYDNQWLMPFDEPLPKLMGLKDKFHFVDIFNDGKDGIVRLLQDCPRPLGIFFDDGDKPREWATFGPLTRPGDIIAVHDWGTEFKEADIGSLPVVRILGKLADKRPSGWKAMWFQRT